MALKYTLEGGSLHQEVEDNSEEVVIPEFFNGENVSKLTITWCGDKNVTLKVPKDISSINFFPQVGSPWDWMPYLYFEIDPANNYYMSKNGSLFHKNGSFCEFAHLNSYEVPDDSVFSEYRPILSADSLDSLGEELHESYCMKLCKICDYVFDGSYVGWDLAKYHILIENYTPSFRHITWDTPKLLIKNCSVSEGFGLKGYYGCVVENLSITATSKDATWGTVENCKIKNLVVGQGVKLQKESFRNCEIDNLVIQGKDICIEEGAFSGGEPRWGKTTINTLRIEGSISECSSAAFDESSGVKTRIEVNSCLKDAKRYIKGLVQAPRNQGVPVLLFRDPGCNDNLVNGNHVVSLTQVIEDVHRPGCVSYQEKISANEYIDSQTIAISTYSPIIVKDYNIEYYESSVKGCEIIVVEDKGNRELLGTKIHVREPKEEVIKRLCQANIPISE